MTFSSPNRDRGHDKRRKNLYTIGIGPASSHSRMRLRITLTLFLAATVARGATYVVGTDRDMVRSSTAIAIVTAGQSVSLRGPRGTIETSTRMHIDEAVAGPIASGETIDIVELGGMVGDV